MRLLPFLAACLLLPAQAFATADGPDTWQVTGVAQDDVLNLRAGPSARTQILGRIPPNTDGLPNLGCIGFLTIDEWSNATEAERAAARRKVWCLTGYDKRFGWVAHRFLREGSPDADAFKGGTRVQTLPRGTWRLARLGEDLITDRRGPKLQIFPSQKMAGFTGCDRFSGGYAASRRLTLFIVKTHTRNKCLASLRAIERRFKVMVDRARDWVGSKSVLSVMDDDKRIIATFVRDR